MRRRLSCTACRAAPPTAATVTAGQAGDRLDGEDSPSTCFPIARSAGGPAVRVPLCRVTIPAESVPRSSATPPRSSRRRMVPLRPHMWKGRRTNESRDDVVARKLVPADQPSRKGLCHGVLRRKWNGGDTPRVTIGQPGDSAAGWAFAIDLTGRCTLQDTEGYVAALEPDCGLYDLGQLAWTSSTSPRGIHTRALGTWSLRARGGARLFDLRSRHRFRCARRVAGRGVCCLPGEWHRRGPTSDECQITIQAAPVSRPRAETVNWSDYWNGARGFEPWFEISWCPWLTKPRTSLPVRGRESMISKQ